MKKELCCEHAEAMSGEPCEGHEIAGAAINIMIISEAELAEKWRRLSCAYHGICTPPCLEGEDAYGCCDLCDVEFASCRDRCFGREKGTNDPRGV